MPFFRDDRRRFDCINFNDMNITSILECILYTDNKFIVKSWGVPKSIKAQGTIFKFHSSFSNRRISLPAARELGFAIKCYRFPSATQSALVLIMIIVMTQLIDPLWPASANRERQILWHHSTHIPLDDLSLTLIRRGEYGRHSCSLTLARLPSI